MTKISIQDEKEIDKLINEFEKQNREEKKSIVIKILNKHLDLNPVFGNLINRITSDYNISDDFITNVYKELLVLGAKGKNNIQNESINILVKMHEYIEKIHKKEEEERKGENIDSILDNI